MPSNVPICYIPLYLIRYKGGEEHKIKQQEERKRQQEQARLIQQQERKIQKSYYEIEREEVDKREKKFKKNKEKYKDKYQKECRKHKKTTALLEKITKEKPQKQNNAIVSSYPSAIISNSVSSLKKKIEIPIQLDQVDSPETQKKRVELSKKRRERGMDMLIEESNLASIVSPATTRESSIVNSVSSLGKTIEISMHFDQVDSPETQKKRAELSKKRRERGMDMLIEESNLASIVSPATTRESSSTPIQDETTLEVNFSRILSFSSKDSSSSVVNANSDSEIYRVNTDNIEELVTLLKEAQNKKESYDKCLRFLRSGQKFSDTSTSITADKIQYLHDEKEKEIYNLKKQLEALALDRETTRESTHRSSFYFHR